MTIRKYRVLDDCSRLRDIVNALPAGRHFVPSLLVITWIDAHVGNILSDFTMMASQFIQDGILGGHQTFSISSETRDLDIKLDQAVSALGLDLEGQLVHHLSIPGSHLRLVLRDVCLIVLQPFSRRSGRFGAISYLNG